MARSAIFYGKMPADFIKTLVAQYGVSVKLNAEKLESWMLAALKEGAYDVLVVNQSAPKAQMLTDVVRQERHIPVVMLDANTSAADALASITQTMQWEKGGSTVFVELACIKGGVGKSTIACLIADILVTEKGKRVLLIDDNAAQANAAHMLTDAILPKLRAADMGRLAEALPEHISHARERLDVLLPEDYMSQGGVTLADATNFWRMIDALAYDYVVVDTTPNPALPEKADSWVTVHLSSCLIMDGSFPTVFVVPFTPVPFGWEGVETTKELLGSRAMTEWMIPVIVANDAEHIVENIPAWLKTDEWRERIEVAPYNRALHDTRNEVFKPGRPTGLKKVLLPDHFKPYRPIVEHVMALAERRLNGR